MAFALNACAPINVLTKLNLQYHLRQNFIYYYYYFLILQTVCSMFYESVY